MEPTAKTRLFAVTRTFALLFAAVCLVMGALELILNDDAGVVLFLLLCASGMAILLGVSAQRRSPLLAAVLISTGAALGGLVLAWTVVAPFVALALIVLSVLLARELTASPVAPQRRRGVDVKDPAGSPTGDGRRSGSD